MISSDSAGNLRQNIKLENDYAVSHNLRMGWLYRQGFINNTLADAAAPMQQTLNAGISIQWHPNDVVKLDSSVGVSAMSSTTSADGLAVSQAVIPVASVRTTIKPAGDSVRLDLGFERFLFDLSPELVSNRVVRNDFVVHPQIGLSSGWRFRELAEIGPVARPGESNNRYNSEFTVARQLKKSSELYGTFTTLHYAKESDAGYFSPDLVENLEGGWSTDITRKTVAASVDLGLGAGRARSHGEAFGHWGLSGHAETDLTWSVRHGAQIHASLEYYYDQSTPAVETTQTGPWHMTVLTVSFRWARE